MVADSQDRARATSRGLLNRAWAGMTEPAVRHWEEQPVADLIRRILQAHSRRRPRRSASLPRRSLGEPIPPVVRWSRSPAGPTRSAQELLASRSRGPGGAAVPDSDVATTRPGPPALPEVPSARVSAVRAPGSGRPSHRRGAGRRFGRSVAEEPGRIPCWLSGNRAGVTAPRRPSNSSVRQRRSGMTRPASRREGGRRPAPPCFDRPSCFPSDRPVGSVPPSRA